jgi:hypothetical protein
MVSQEFPMPTHPTFWKAPLETQSADSWTSRSNDLDEVHRMLVLPTIDKWIGHRLGSLLSSEADYATEVVWNVTDDIEDDEDVCESLGTMEPLYTDS